MMLQLVQSPSARVQRLIETDCRKKENKSEDEQPLDGKESGVEKLKGDTSESRLDTDSVISSYSSSSNKRPTTRRVSRVTDRGNGVVVASSSFSSSDQDDDQGDDDEDVGNDSEYVQ